MNNTTCYCFDCKYCLQVSVGAFRCQFRHFPREYTCETPKCAYTRSIMTKDIAVKVIHDYQKYRRGSGSIKDCPPPYLIGVALDFALGFMRRR